MGSLGQMSAISEQDYQRVSELLGREPRGLVSIPVRSVAGEPVVIQVESLVDDKPFPTLYWLVDKHLNYAIDQLEAAGTIAQLQAQVDASPELQAQMAADHRAYIDSRHQLMSPAISERIQELGFAEVLQRRGIGGIENFTRIRCLHTYYAAHLVTANEVGSMVNQLWQAQAITFDHLP